MTPRRYSLGWRIAATALSIATLAALGTTRLGGAHALHWAEAGGAALVLLLLPYVALTGRAPRWLDRLTRRDV